MEINLAELKTKNVKKDKIILKPIHSPLLLEREYKAFINSMVRELFKEVEEQLMPTTREFIEDSSLKDIRDIIEELKNIFSIKKITEFLIYYFNKVFDRNTKKIISVINQDVGVNVGNFLIVYDEESQAFLEAIIAKNVILVKSVGDDALRNIEKIIIDGHIQGSTIKEIRSQIFPLVIKDGMKASELRKARTRAETIAITETAKANSSMTQRRFKQLEIEKVMWSATRDKRTRKCHMARHGSVYDIDKGCWSSCDGKTIQTGYEVRCRCAMLGVVE